jgi:hypothetical protein
MGRLVGLTLVLAFLAGTTMTIYNVYTYEVLSPFPLPWTHSPAEFELVELLRTREALVRRLASARRIENVSGLAVLAPATPGTEGEAELAALDGRIAALRAALAAGR